MPESGPFVIMVVGVNGVGKTTTIGKIAAQVRPAPDSPCSWWPETPSAPLPSPS